MSERAIDKVRADAAFEANARLACKCGSRTPPALVMRDMGRSKSYRLVCGGCGKSSSTTFYANKVTEKWNEVAALDD